MGEVLPNRDCQYRARARTFYLPPPPKKPLASRRICCRMNGSGSAPITMDPGWPHGVQQTKLPGGVFRYPWAAYDGCCRYFCRASAGEARTIVRPSVDATNPTETAVLLIDMESSIDSRPAAPNMASTAATGQPMGITTPCHSCHSCALR